MPEFRALLAGGGEMGERIRVHDWAATPLGPPRDWPQSLRSALSICLNSVYPMAVYWGPELRLFYNDAWAPIPGPRHPDALGRPAREVWADIWPVVGPQFEAVMATGKGWSASEQLLPMRRYGRIEETYWDYSLTPIAGEDGMVAGILNQGQDASERVFERKRHLLLLALADRLRLLESANEIFAAAMPMIAEHFGVGRAGYGEIDLAGDAIAIEHVWTDGAMPTLPQRIPLGGFGSALHDALRSGEPFWIDDTHRDGRIAAEATLPAYEATGMRAGLVAPVVRDGVYEAALFIHDAGPRDWESYEILTLMAAAERIHQDVSRARAKTALRGSDERYRLIFEQAHDMIFTADLDQTITKVNPAAAEALGASAAAVAGTSIGRYVSAEDFVRTSEMLRRKLREGGTTRYEVDVRSIDGRTMRWEINSALAIDHDGDAIGLHAIARDVTERHAQERSQQLLINELNHRVKNTLAIVQGLAQQSFREGIEPVEAQRAFQARLGMLASAHDLLTREKWEGATLHELIVDATRAHADRIEIAGPPVVLNPKAAVSLVLAVHELVTNAAKHGALTRAEGRVTLRWEHAAAGRLRIDWVERGGPPVVVPQRRGFGLRMIERALAHDLDGTVRIDFAPDGLRCTIDAADPQAVMTSAMPVQEVAA